MASSLLISVDSVSETSAAGSVDGGGGSEGRSAGGVASSVQKRGASACPACSATTSSARYRRDGYWRRPIRNLCLLALYFLGVSPKRLARLYG